VPPGVQIAAAWSWRFMAIVGALAVALLLVIQLNFLVVPLLIAVLLAVLATRISHFSCDVRCLLLHARSTDVPALETFQIVWPIFMRAGSWRALLERMVGSDDGHRLAQATYRAWNAAASRETTSRYAVETALKLSHATRVRVFAAIGATPRAREAQLLQPMIDEAEDSADEVRRLVPVNPRRTALRLHAALVT